MAANLKFFSVCVFKVAQLTLFESKHSFELSAQKRGKFRVGETNSM